MMKICSTTVNKHNFRMISINEHGAKEYLTANGWPVGLQATATRSMMKFPIRFMIIDDSGSMGSSDGNRVIRSGDKCV